MSEALVDTHAHLSASEFDADRDDVLSRARAAGVTTVLAVSETLEDAKTNHALAATYPGMVRPLAGLHPEYPDTSQAEQLVEWIREHRHGLVGIGEVGLDYWRIRDEAARERQLANFERFIDLSLELDLPLNVHSRSAGERAVACLLDRGAHRVQLHAFDARASRAMPAVEAGYYFSIPPSVVRSPQKQKLVRRLPLRCLLLETDSPVLGPVAGERNVPANLLISLRAIAEIKGVPEDEVRSAVAESTRRLWGVGGVGSGDA